MPELNISLPPIAVYIPDKYYHRPAEENIFNGGVLLSACSVPGQPLLFQVLYRNGVLYERLPLSALRTENKNWWAALPKPQIWDCPSAHVTFTQYPLLQDAVVHLDKDVSFLGTVRGRYVGTFDWYGDALSEGAGDLGHKAAHLIHLPSPGYFLLRPNDYVRFEVPAWTGELSEVVDPPIRNQQHYSCEGLGFSVAEPLDTSVPKHFPPAPEGWRVVAKRPALSGEWVLGADCFRGAFEAQQLAATTGRAEYILERK